MKNCIRRRHNFSDFVWFSMLGWTPVLVACLAIASSSLLWMAAYLGVMLLLGLVEIGFLCRHCPYFAQEPGLTVHCKAMWGPTKWSRPKPGRLSRLDRGVFSFFMLAALAFPVYWLIPQWQFFLIYVVSVALMFFTLTRYECNRCMFFDCPFNRVSKEAKKEAQDTAE